MAGNTHTGKVVANARPSAQGAHRFEVCRPPWGNGSVRLRLCCRRTVVHDTWYGPVARRSSRLEVYRWATVQSNHLMRGQTSEVGNLCDGGNTMHLAIGRVAHINARSGPSNRSLTNNSHASLAPSSVPACGRAVAGGCVHWISCWLAGAGSAYACSTTTHTFTHANLERRCWQLSTSRSTPPEIDASSMFRRGGCRCSSRL
jgi:hypothetical protein